MTEPDEELDLCQVCQEAPGVSSCNGCLADVCDECKSMYDDACELCYDEEDDELP